MKDKAQVLLELEKLTRVKEELTEEVTRLHKLLEQERSSPKANTTNNPDTTTSQKSRHKEKVRQQITHCFVQTKWAACNLRKYFFFTFSSLFFFWYVNFLLAASLIHPTILLISDKEEEQVGLNGLFHKVPIYPLKTVCS